VATAVDNALPLHRDAVVVAFNVGCYVAVTASLLRCTVAAAAG